MGYCTIGEVDNLLAQALTSATNSTSQARRNLLQIGKTRDKNSISDDIINQYIRWACQEIDSHFNQLYKVPFCEQVAFQTSLVSDITEYNSYLVLEKACSLSSGDQIILTDGTDEERHEIYEVIGNAVFSTLETISVPFAAGTRLLHVKFPDPVPWIAARLTAANVYDKYYSAQVSPNISDYGKFLRNQAMQKINSVLTGKTILFGVQRVGRVLYDPNIDAQYVLGFRLQI